jgi:hypothetical protein
LTSDEPITENERTLKSNASYVADVRAALWTSDQMSRVWVDVGPRMFSGRLVIEEITQTEDGDIVLYVGTPASVPVEQDPTSGRWYKLDAEGNRRHGPYLSEREARG